jgi:type IV pilus assembly protein PilA
MANGVAGVPGVSPTPRPPSANKAGKMSTGVKILLICVVGGFGVLALIGIVAAIAIPALMRARIPANEASAIGTMRIIASAQLTYASSCAGGKFAASLPVLTKAPTNGTGGAPFITENLGFTDRVRHAGYVHWIEVPRARTAGLAASTPTAPPCNGVGADALSESFIARAEPIGPTTGHRYFATNETGVVYESDEPITFRSDGAANLPATPVK